MQGNGYIEVPSPDEASELLMDELYANDGLIMKSDLVKQLDAWARNICDPKQYVREDAILVITDMPTAECVEYYKFSECLDRSRG